MLNLYSKHVDQQEKNRKKVMAKERRVKFESKYGTILRGVLITPEEGTKGAVVLSHGITGEKREKGFYQRLGELLAGKGIETLCFDFRGHGKSGGKSWEMTIKGEINDLTAAVDLLRLRGHGKISVIGYSFGGGISVLYTKRKPNMVSSLTLLAPVLDYKRTFLEPETKIPREWFTEESITKAKRTGRFDLSGFLLGHHLLREFSRYKPGEDLLKLETPALIIHGTEDNYVPYEVARNYAKKYEQGRFLSVKNAGHSLIGFEKMIFPAIIKWVKKWM